MSLKDVLAELTRHNIKLSVEDGQLRVRAAKGVMTQQLKTLLQDNKPDLIAWVLEKNAAQLNTTLIARRQHDVDVPLSFSQQRLWVVDQLSPGITAYNMPVAVKLIGQLDITVLEQVFSEIVQRHEILRTIFVSHDGIATQCVQTAETVQLRPEPCPLNVAVDVTAHNTSTHELQAIAEQEAAVPFDLTKGPLFRIRLMTLEPSINGEPQFLLTVILHHIISDGWSSGVLMREIATLYEAFKQGKPSPLPDLSIQYGDYAVWQRQWLVGDVLEAKLHYWRDLLKDTPVLELPTDRIRPAAQTFNGSHCLFDISSEVGNALTDMARRESTTLFNVLLVAFYVLLHRYSGQHDICIGTPVANRTKIELEPLIGFFVNTLALRLTINGTASFTELLEQVKQLTNAAQVNQDVPFERIVEELGLARDMSYSPLFQVLFSVSGKQQGSPPTITDLAFESIDIDSKTSKVDLTFAISEMPDGSLIVNVEYSTDLFEASSIEQMFACFKQLLSSVISDSSLPVASLAILDDSARNHILYDWNDTASDYQKEYCLHRLFEIQAVKRANDIALAFDGSLITYRELNQLSNQYAHFLLEKNVKPGDPIAICLDRSTEMILSMLAVLKVGACYVPLSPEYPLDRLEYMMADTQAPVLITDKSSLSAVQDLSAVTDNKTFLFNIDVERDVLATMPIKNLSFGGGVNPAEQLAYIIYTSGSTGQPKGVCVPHLGVLRLVLNTNYVTIHEDDHIAHASNVSFDAATFEIWGALLNGARLVGLAKESLLTPEQFKLDIQRLNIDIIFITTALFNLYAKADAAIFNSLRYVLFGGEACDPRLIRRVIDAQPPQHLLHMYGPTENTTFSTFYDIRQVAEEALTVPIGGPVANSQCYILNELAEPVPAGVIGEMYMAGEGLARGYLNRDDLNGEVFVDNPFQHGKKMYRTGDLGRYNAQGNIEILGRIDDQVKIRGFRIELGEIEAAISRFDSVGECVVVVAETDGQDGAANNRFLTAYIVPADVEGVCSDDSVPEASSSFIAELRLALRDKLPEYMVPAVFMLIDHMPLTANTKIDKRALPPPDLSNLSAHEYIAPRNAIETLVAEVWMVFLSVERLSVLDNFFELGGHSLLATQVISALRDRCQLDLGLKAIFEAPTVEQLASYIENQLLTHHISIAPPLEPAERDNRIPLSFAQQRLWFIDQLEPGSTAYNMPMAFRLQGELDIGKLSVAINTVVTRHESLRTTISTDNGQPYQVIHEVETLTFAVVDLMQELTGTSTGLTDGLASDAAAIERLAQQKVADEALLPFDLAEGPLFRVSLLALADTDHVLMVTLHHIIADGWSMEVMMKEVVAGYQQLMANETIHLPQLSIQYADYTYWQRRWLAGDALERQLNYWRVTLAGAPDLLRLPTDRPRPAVQTSRGAGYDFAIDSTLTAKARAFCQERDVTLFMLLLAAYKILLAKYSNQYDVVVGIPVAGRNHSKVEDLIGFFVNALVIRTNLSGNPKVEDCLSAVKAATLGAFSHQEVPTEAILDALEINRSAAYSPLAQVGFNYLPQRAKQNDVVIEGLDISPFFSDTVTAKYDLIVSFYDTGEHLVGGAEYRTDLFDESTIQQMMQHFSVLLTALIDSVDNQINNLALIGDEELYRVLELSPDKYQAIHPLTAMQRDLYLASVVNPDTRQNSLGYAINITSHMDMALWREVLQQVANHFSILRTEIVVSDKPYTDTAYQAVRHQIDIDLDIIDWSDRDISDQEVTSYIDNYIYRTYNIHTDSLFNYLMIKLGAERYVLVLATHHALLDGIGIMAHILCAAGCYEAAVQGGDLKGRLRAEDDKFPEYIAFNRCHFDTPAVNQFWQTSLANVEPLDIPGSSYLAESVGKISKTLEIDDAHWAKIKQYCFKKRITPSLYFKAIYGLLLKLYCRPTADFQVHEFTSGRPSGHELSLGCYYQSIPCLFQLAKLQSDTPVDELFLAIKQFQESIKENQYVSIFQQRQLFKQGRLNFSYNLVNMTDSGTFLGKEERYRKRYTPDADGVIQFLVRIGVKSLQIHLDYPGELFDDNGFLQRVEHVSRQLIGGIDTLAELDYLVDSERQALLSREPGQFNGSVKRYDGVNSVQVLFERQAEQTPDNVALIVGSQQLSYRELNARANSLAHYLREKSIGSGSRVAICLKRSVDMMVAVLGVIKSGAAYIPMDANYPRQRLAFMLADSASPLLITQRSVLADGLADVLDADRDKYTASLLVMDEDEEKISSLSSANPDNITQLDDRLYYIYTSGSTGQPKGTGVKHRGEVNLLQWYASEFAISADDKVLIISAFGFDLTQKNLFAALTQGGTVILPDVDDYDADYFIELIAEHSATLMNCAPSAFYPLVQCCDDFGKLASLRLLLFGGEPIHLSGLSKWIYHDSFHCEVVNMYGPTECTDIAAFYRITDIRTQLETKDAIIPIGYPNDNVQLYVLNENGQLVPPGIAGELYIAGDGIGVGYLKRGQLTGEKFRKNPFGEGLIYRTGDIVRFKPDGALPTAPLEYLDRVDFQVKIRGLRIELGEVQFALRQLHNVDDAIVLVKEDVLIGYVIGDTVSIGSDNWRSTLSHYLPDYMIPHQLIGLSQWPLTPNGKVDRQALLAMGSQAVVTAPFVAPASELEKAVADIWCDLLNVSQVGVNDNFFELGGHSLLATQVAARIREAFDVDVSLRSLFDTPTVAGIVREVQYKQQQGQRINAPELTPKPRNSDGSATGLPLSFAQQRLWFIDQLQPGNSAYNMPMALRIEGELKLDVLKQVINALVKRHEGLRTVFETNDGIGYQVIQPYREWDIESDDISTLAADRQAHEAQRLIEEEAAKPFDLQTGPLFRVRILRLSNNDQDMSVHVLMATMHHIIADGVSLNVLTKELALLYLSYSEGNPSPLPINTLQYADFATWQREWLQGDILASQIQYWRDNLHKVPPLDLPADKVRPPLMTFSGADHEFAIARDISDQLRSLGLGAGATPFMTLLSAFSVLIARLSGQDDFCIGTPTANRNRAEIENMVGFFVNTLALRIDTSDEPTFLELLQRVRSVTLGAQDNQDLPFERVVEEVGVTRALDRSPLFQVSFNYQQTSHDMEMATSDIIISAITPEFKAMKDDLSLTVVESDSQLHCSMGYRTDLFEASTIERMAGYFTTLLASIAQAPSKPIGHYCLLSDEQQKSLIAGNNETTVNNPELPAYQLIEQQVEKAPHHVACQFGETAMTYDELNSRANQLARYLIDKGISEGDMVGVCVSRSNHMLVALLAVWKSGAAYVPLDPDYPLARTQYVIESAALNVIVSEEELLAKLPAANEKYICIDRDEVEIASKDSTNLNSQISSDRALVYTIFTSGSTGKPKGVVISHRAFTNFLCGMKNTVGMEVDDVLLAVTSLSFDIAGLELFLPLMYGAKVIIASRAEAMDGNELASLIQIHSVNTLQATPATWHLLVNTAWSAPQLDKPFKGLCGGEPLPPKLASELVERGVRLFNMYGPTETTVWSSVYEVVEDNGSSVPIGRPIDNTQLYVLDQQMRPVPIGMTGELYIGGVGLAEGYLGRDDLTAERFIANPFFQLEGAHSQLIYRTGDLARYLPDGNLQCLGRIDHQVKVRGFRIELGEIESALIRHAGVQEGVVAAVEIAPGNHILVGYVVPKHEQVSVTELQVYLKQTLPDYMVPSAFVMLSQLPLTANGKIDRKALPKPEGMLESSAAYLSPRNETEEKLVAIWQAVLPVEQVGVLDNFFEIGGHSLLAVQVVSRVREEFAVEIPLSALFDVLTVEGMAKYIESAVWALEGGAEREADDDVDREEFEL